MTKISSKTAYPKKTPIVNDYFIGTNSENFGETVNFGFEETASLINKLNGTPIINYVFSTSPYLSTEVLLEGRFLSDENELSTPSLTKLHVNKFNNSGDNLQELYLFLQTNATDFYLKLRNSNNQNNAVYFDIASIEDFPDYFILNITVFKENEFFPLLENLNVYFFDFELKATSAGTSDPLKLDKDGYTGTAKDIDDRILVLENQTDVDNAFITKPTFSLSANTLTIDALGQWRLLGVAYSNPTSVDFPITFCTTGKTRLVYFVPNSANGFTQVSGTETLGIAIQPQLPNENLYVTYVLVSDSGVGEPVIPPAFATPSLQQITDVGAVTTKPITVIDYSLNRGISIWNNVFSFWKRISGVPVTVNTFIDDVSESYNVQFPNKTGGEEETFAMVSDLTKSQVGLSNVDNTSDANKPVSGPQQTALDLKLDASAYNQHFKGVYVTLAALNSALPTASIGDYAQVNEVGGTDVLNYNWDNEESIWVAGGGTGGVANTDALPEGSTNLYWTVARFLANLTAANIKAALGYTPENIANKQNSLAVDGAGVKYPTVDAVNTIKRHTKEITVGAGGTYATLELLFANEPAGKTLIKLTDTQYTCLNPKFLVKTGWILQGQGYGKTNITFNFTTAIDPYLSGLQIRTDCELVDFKVTSINNTNSGGFSQYALHSDYVGAFTAKITRCWFKTVASPDVVDASGYNGLAVGIGTWEGQVLEFHESILQGQSVSIDDRYTLNLHNTFISGVHTIPSRVSFYNSQLTGGFTTVLISDTYSNSSESDSSRIKDLFEFVGCEIKGGIYLRSANQIGGTDRKNGLAFNFSGTNIDEFINVGEIVNTSLSNYDVTSLPLTKDVDFQKNLGTSTINEGDFVSYVYANRIPEYHRPEVITTPIGIEKLNSTNIKYFAGISLTNSAVGNFAHIAKGSIAYTKDAFSNIEIGAKLAFNDNGVLVKSSISGIGTVIKKTTDNRLGIFLTPNGRKENTIGTYTDRGLLEISGNSGGVGQPSIFLSDKNILNEFTNYAISAGSNSEAFLPYEKGRFSINDNIVGRERFAIAGNGDVSVNRKLTIFSVENTEDPSGYSDTSSATIYGKNKNSGISATDNGNLQLYTVDNQGIGIGAGIALGGRYTDSGVYSNFAKIYGKKENSISGSFDGRLVFETSNNTTDPYSREVGSFSSAGNLTVLGTVTAAGFFQSSDIRLKNVVERNYQKDSITDIKAISYYWKDSSRGTEIQLGYSAQDVQKIIPQAVNEDKNGELSVNYIQVLIAKIEALENIVNELKHK